MFHLILSSLWANQTNVSTVCSSSLSPHETVFCWFASLAAASASGDKSLCGSILKTWRWLWGGDGMSLTLTVMNWTSNQQPATSNQQPAGLLPKVCSKTAESSTRLKAAVWPTHRSEFQQECERRNTCRQTANRWTQVLQAEHTHTHTHKDRSNTDKQPQVQSS